MYQYMLYFPIYILKIISLNSLFLIILYIIGLYFIILLFYTYLFIINNFYNFCHITLSIFIKIVNLFIQDCELNYIN